MRNQRLVSEHLKTVTYQHLFNFIDFFLSKSQKFLALSFKRLFNSLAVKESQV